MRIALALTLLIAGLALNGVASAADHVRGSAMQVNHHISHHARAPQLLVYDNGPGVYVRSYWSTPWQGRHYYPFTGKKPKVGRHENLNAKRVLPPPAESFYREWSTLSLYPPEPVIEQVADEQPPLK